MHVRIVPVYALQGTEAQRIEAHKNKVRASSPVKKKYLTGLFIYSKISKVESQQETDEVETWRKS